MSSLYGAPRGQYGLPCHTLLTAGRTLDSECYVLLLISPKLITSACPVWSKRMRHSGRSYVRLIFSPTRIYTSFTSTGHLPRSHVWTLLRIVVHALGTVRLACILEGTELTSHTQDGTCSPVSSSTCSSYLPVSLLSYVK
jgi:hypothetical protein